MKFDDAVEEYTTYLLKLSYLYVKNKEVAEDIVQEVFIKLYQNYGDQLPLENSKIPEPLEPLDPQPELPYNTEDFELKVTTNDQGDYIYVLSTSFYFYISPIYRDFLSDLSFHIVKEDLTRHSFKRHQEALKNFQSDDPEQIKIANECSSILEILERTIDMEFDFSKKQE